MSDLDQLIEMGFSMEKAKRALEITNNKGVEPAMEWLIAHADEEIPVEVVDTSKPTTTTSSAESTEPANDNIDPASDQEAKSIKCDECQRLFKSQMEVEFHAAKSGHSAFSESTEEKKPLTEDEKKRQLVIIEEKLRLKRIEREETEKKEALDRERNRIKSGKDLTEIRRKMEEQEMTKILEQRKREKLEEKAARDRVKAKIEEDKLNRRMKAEKSAGAGADSTATVSAPAPPPAVVASSAPTKEYTTTRIQIRLQDGSTLVQQFNVKEPLAAVRLFVQMKIGDAPFGMMTNFPKKLFADEDFDAPLDKLGLVPSAVLIVTKCP